MKAPGAVVWSRLLVRRGGADRTNGVALATQRRLSGTKGDSRGRLLLRRSQIAQAAGRSKTDGSRDQPPPGMELKKKSTLQLFSELREKAQREARTRMLDSHERFDNLVKHTEIGRRTQQQSANRAGDVPARSKGSKGISYSDRCILHTLAFPFLTPSPSQTYAVHCGYRLQAALLVNRMPQRYTEPHWMREFRKFKEAWQARTHTGLTLSEELIDMKLPHTWSPPLRGDGPAGSDLIPVSSSVDTTSELVPVGKLMNTAAISPSDALSALRQPESAQAARNRFYGCPMEGDSNPHIVEQTRDAPAGNDTSLISANSGAASSKHDLQDQQIGHRPGRRHPLATRRLLETPLSDVSRFPEDLLTLVVWYPAPRPVDNSTDATGTWSLPIADHKYSDPMAKTIYDAVKFQLGKHLEVHLPNACPIGHSVSQFEPHWIQKFAIRGLQRLFYRLYAVPGNRKIDLPRNSPVHRFAWLRTCEAELVLPPDQADILRRCGLLG